MATKIAIVSLVVSGLTLLWSAGWSVFVWRASRKTRVALVCRVVRSTEPSGYAACIEVVNHSEHEITIKGAGFRRQSPERTPLVLLVGSSMRVLPRDSALLGADLASAETAGLDLARPVTAWARLGDGTVILQRVAQLGSREEADSLMQSTPVI